MTTPEDRSPEHRSPEGPTPDDWTRDPELVAVYDVENAGRWDHDFYLELARELGAERVTDIGCGTGVLAVDLAEAGVQVVALDPSEAMLETARARPGAASVHWIHGYADRLKGQASDLVVMEGHVAQYFLPRAAWDEVLGHAHRNLVPGGHLAFESRNPAAMELDDWDAESTRETQEHPEGGTFTSWLELVGVEDTQDDGALITHRGHTVLPDGRHRIAEETLRYRSLQTLWESLEQAGFTVTGLWGDWDREEFDPESPEIILLARKTL